jgi:hypothetical protein
VFSGQQDHQPQFQTFMLDGAAPAGRSGLQQLPVLQALFAERRHLLYPAWQVIPPAGDNS